MWAHGANGIEHSHRVRETDEEDDEQLCVGVQQDAARLAFLRKHEVTDRRGGGSASIAVPVRPYALLSRYPVIRWGSDWFMGCASRFCIEPCDVGLMQATPAAGDAKNCRSTAPEWPRS
jgi:hypothetical protein